MDGELIRDLYLCLNNEGEFYPTLSALYRSAEEKYLKGEYDSAKFIGALEKRIAHFLLHGPKHFSYNREMSGIKVDKGHRIEVAKEFEDFFLGELKLGNTWLTISRGSNSQKGRD